MASSQSSVKDQAGTTNQQNSNNKSFQENSYSRVGGKGKGLSDSEDYTNTVKQSGDQTHVSQKHDIQNDENMQVDQEGAAVEQDLQPKLVPQNSIQLSITMKKKEASEVVEDTPMDQQ